jgi:tRNA pseudouridine38-40 synthase
MRAALGALVGTHDFASFQAAGSKPGPTIRRLDRAELLEDGPSLAIELAGSGFLRHMVRNAVGTILEVGRGRRRADSMPALLAALDRSAAGPTAPGRGLTLVRVEYGPKPAD